MQAAARSYRLNQTHALCKVVYLFYQQSMEHHMIQLMSRKQRAAKLLNGEIGLSGLDALTEGEGGLEESLMQAIGQETSLLDPTQLFKTDHVTSAIDEDDAAFWNVVASSEPVSELPLLIASPTDSLVQVGQQLGATITPFTLVADPVRPVEITTIAVLQESSKLVIALTAKFGPVSRLTQERQAKVQARLVQALEQGVPHPTDGALKLCEGVLHPDFARYPVHSESLTRWIAKYLRAEKALDPNQIMAFAAELVKCAVETSTAQPSQITEQRVKGKSNAKARKLKPDLMAIPEDHPTKGESTSPKPTPASRSQVAPRQLVLFNLPQAYA